MKQEAPLFRAGRKSHDEGDEDLTLQVSIDKNGLHIKALGPGDTGKVEGFSIDWADLFEYMVKETTR